MKKRNTMIREARRAAVYQLIDSVAGAQGEGLIPGGLMVLRSGTGGVVYAHQEQVLGDHAPIAEVRTGNGAAPNLPLEASRGPCARRMFKHVSGPPPPRAQEHVKRRRLPGRMLLGKAAQRLHANADSQNPAVQVLAAAKKAAS